MSEASSVLGVAAFWNVTNLSLNPAEFLFSTNLAEHFHSWNNVSYDVGYEIDTAFYEPPVVNRG